VSVVAFDPSRSRLGGVLLSLVAATMLLVACSSPADQVAPEGSAAVGPAMSTPEGGRFPDGTKVRLLAHDSFAVSDAVLEQFTAATNIEVEIVLGGDAVAMVNQAVLTAGNPQADVLFGVDDNTLGRAVDAELFAPYRSPGLVAVPASLQAPVADLVTPVDYGDICVNYDRVWFRDRGLPVPATIEALADPAYRDLLVVQDPSASSPGLGFMLATIAQIGGGEDTTDTAPWLAYWQRLKDNSVKVVDSWETAYFTEFSGSSGKGPRPLVVSYASSPAAEVTDPSIPADQAPTGSISSTCYRQVEYAGLLRGASNPAAGQALIDFMLSVDFQQDVPGQMFVFPVNADAALPEAFARFVEPVPAPLTVPAAQVDADRDRWIQQWSALFR
jgi:thiamine transport system substrate-binding protein